MAASEISICTGECVGTIGILSGTAPSRRQRSQQQLPLERERVGEQMSPEAAQTEIPAVTARFLLEGTLKTSPPPQGNAIMSHKKTHGAPVPPGNQPQRGPGGKIKPAGKNQKVAGNPASAQQHDPKERIGDYDGKGQHSMQEPGGKNDANH